MSKQNEIKTPVYQKASFKIIRTEENAFIINVSGWNMRVYTQNEIKNPKQYDGRIMEFEYIGNIEEPLKDVPRFKKVLL